MMGTIALLRQSFLDAQWYKQRPAEEGVNMSLQAWNDNLSCHKYLKQMINGIVFVPTGSEMNLVCNIL